MTQIISLATPRYALQVSDRLVSTQEGKEGPLRSYDSRFNKHILFGAKNAIVTIGFSGLAYLEKVPTDQWIAAALAGERPTDPQGGPGKGMRIRTPPQGRIVASDWPDIGIATENLQKGLSHVFRGLSRGEKEAGLSLAIIGWQWKWHWSSVDKIRRVRPIIINMSYDAGAETFQVNPSPRYWGWEKGGFGIKATPQLPRDIHNEVWSLLNSPPDNLLTDDTAENILISAIRKLAEVPNRGVGPDVISVSINVHREPVVRVRYHPKTSSANYYTGWVVTSNLIQPPQIVTISSSVIHNMHVGLFDISFEGPSIPSSSGFHASSTGQPPKPPP